MNEELYSALSKCPLFIDIPQEKYSAVLSCLKGEEKSFEKGHVLLFAGETSKRAGVLLSGAARVLMYCADGRIVTVGNLSEGEVFGEALACSPSSGSPLQIEAVTPVKALYLDFDPLLAEQLSVPLPCNPEPAAFNVKGITAAQREDKSPCRAKA